MSASKNGDFESIIYLEGIFEYHQFSTQNGTVIERKNHIQLQGGIDIRVGGYALARLVNELKIIGFRYSLQEFRQTQ